MAVVIELKRGEEPRPRERFALVIVSERPPQEGAAKAHHSDGRTFFAYDNEQDVAAVVARAKAWAEENIVARVYLRRNVD